MTPSQGHQSGVFTVNLEHQSSIVILQYFSNLALPSNYLGHIRTKWMIPYDKHNKIYWCYLFVRLRSDYPLICTLWKVKFSLYRKMVKGLTLMKNGEATLDFSLWMADKGLTNQITDVSIWCYKIRSIHL